MKIPLSELITATHDELQKSRNYISEFSESNQLAFNVCNVEVNIPIIISIENVDVEYKDLERIEERFLELEIPYNFKRSIEKDDSNDKSIDGVKVFCNTTLNKGDVHSTIKLTFKLELK